MKRAVLILTFTGVLLAPGVRLSCQVATSGKMTIHINNKPEAVREEQQERPSEQLKAEETKQEAQVMQAGKKEEKPVQELPEAEPLQVQPLAGADKQEARPAEAVSVPQVVAEKPVTQTIKTEEQAITPVNMQPVTQVQQVNEVPKPEASLLPGVGKYYALVIGINEYADPQITNLDRPIQDAEMFYNTITTRYTFDRENVRFLRNATYADIVESLDYFAKVVGREDNFLIFYAGHGYWDRESEVGYWLPADARRSSKVAWFRNSTLRDYLREIKSKHTLLISDACFSGGIFKTRSVFLDAAPAISKLYELPSRKAMTSGTLTEVPDQSAFLKYMIDRLQKNTEKYLSAEQLFSSFRVAVINNSNVVPQFGEIRDVGDEGGDFIFILR